MSSTILSDDTLFNGGNVDKEIIKDGNKTYISDELNYSPWYFFGTRLSEVDIKLIYKDTKEGKIILRRMKEDGFQY